MTKRVTSVMVLVVLFFLSACDNSPTYPTIPTAPKTVLSDSCDYILCKGTDASGNMYQLVASQEETALGYEITVGIIKNNTWLIPMSSESPFLRAKDGLFPIDDGTDLGYVTRAKYVASHFYFIDLGAFVMKYYLGMSLGDATVIFDCNTMKSHTYYEEDYRMLYLSSKLKTYGSTETFDDVISYGKIWTDDDLILMYKDVSDSYDWSSSKRYDWFVLNTKTMEISIMASDTKLRPECVLAEGLIFASDHCFYNLNMEKIIDLSHYDIDNESIYFKNGECTFIAENDLGTEFEITIDTIGQVLNEVKQ